MLMQWLKKKETFYIGMIIVSVVMANALIFAFTGLRPWQPNPYNSYTLQAISWLQGRLDLLENYSHLELAVYNGKVFVTFPPFPSVIMLPFALMFQENTPDHWINLCFGIGMAICAYKIAKLYIESDITAFFLSLFLCIGSNFLFLTVTGWVWFLAQVMGSFFTLLSFYFVLAKKNNRLYDGLSLLSLACALGCRPFQIIYLPIVLYLMYQPFMHVEQKRLWRFVRYLLIVSIPAILLGCFFMWLNWSRFGNVFEFGHNYLPEHLESEHGQLSTFYLPGNLRGLFALPSFDERGIVHFPQFNGAAFWLVSPIVVVYFFSLVVMSIKKYRVHDDTVSPNATLLFLPFALVVLHLILLCMHNVMGGWHFGHRYTLDALPGMFFGLVYILSFLLKKEGTQEKFIALCTPLFLLGLGLNLIGTIHIYLGIL